MIMPESHESGFLPTQFTGLENEWSHMFVVVAHPTGLTLRTSAIFAEAVDNCPCKILVRNNHMTVDGKGVLSVLSLGADTGTLLEISAHGPGASQALEILAGLTTTEGMNLFSIAAPGVSGSGQAGGGSTH